MSLRVRVLVVALGIASSFAGHLAWEIGSDLLWLNRFRTQVERAQRPAPPADAR